MPWADPYLGSKDAQIALFDDLVSKHPTQIKKEIIGQTLEGRNIPLYRLGNPTAGKWMFDGAIHGCSDLSTIAHHRFLKWLLESNEPRANNILAKKQLLCVPILNIDRTTRKNARNGYWPNGVDLNRNFPANWTNAGTTDPTNDYYRGTSAASEPETQAIIQTWDREHPEIYTNFHNWGGPLNQSYNYTAQQKAFADAMMVNYISLANQMGQQIYPYGSGSVGNIGAGMASSEASKHGVKASLIIEVVYMNGSPVAPNYNQLPTLDMIDSYYWPRLQPYYLTLSEAVTDGSPINPKTYLFKQWQDGDTNPTKIVNL